MATNISETVTGNPRMSVRLIERPTSSFQLAAIAALRCTHNEGFDSLARLALEDRVTIVRRVTASGHTSVLEHVCYTFSVEGISRVTSHQLVRHRLASYSQMSQRYTELFKQKLILPPTITRVMEDKPEVRDAFNEWNLAKARLMDMLDCSGVHDEDLRYLAPQGTETALIVTMNLRELSHFCGLRRCRRAQWEIRELADRMAKEVLSYEPQLDDLLREQCVQLGYCPEGRRSCGNFATLREIKDDADKFALARIQAIHNRLFGEAGETNAINQKQLGYVDKLLDQYHTRKEREETAATKARILAYARAGRDADDIGEGEE